MPPKQDLTKRLSQLKSLAEQIDRLEKTPLSAIAAELKSRLLPLLAPSQNLEIEGPLESLATYSKQLLAALPQSFGDRFFFDALFVSSLADEWNPALELKRFMVPSYDANWGYRSLWLPAIDRKSTRVIDLFLFRGEERSEQIDLLDYPWVVHELGHHLMYRFPNEFPNLFLPSLDEYLVQLQLLSASDRGSARIRADLQRKSLQKFWHPAQDQKNWAHEIAFDVLALWTCGPAFLHAFCSTLESQTPDPYVVDSIHPPYIARMEALRFGSERLKISVELNRLNAARRSSWALIEQRGAKNELLSFAPEVLIKDCVNAALGVAQRLKLRRFQSNVPSAEAICGQPFSSLAVLAAAYGEFRRSPMTYETWQQSLLRKLISQITR